MTVGQASVLEHLEENVEYIRMGLLHLVQQHHRVRLAADRLGQVAAFLEADVARRRADQAGHRVFLHELGHIDPHQRLLGIEEELGQRLAQLGLAHPGRAEEEERAARPVRIGEAGARTAHGVGHGDYRLVLADHSPMQLLLHAQQLLALALEHLRHRDTGPLGNHFGDFLVGHLVAQQLVLGLAVLVDHLQAAFQVRDGLVLDARHALEVALAPRRLHLLLGLLDLLLDLRRALHLGLLGLPDLLEVGVFALELDDILLQLGQALPGGFVVFLLQRLALDLQLDQATVETIQFLRLGVNLHADAAGGLVDQVDGLVRQLPIGDVAVRQLGRGDDRAVGDAHPVVHFIAFLEATEDGDGVFLARFVHQHLLEAALQRGILLDVLAILVEGSSTDAVQLAARQSRLEHVAGVHGAFRLAGADHGVQFVDEQDDPAFLLAQFVEDRLQAFLELAAELGTGDQRPHVQGQQALVLEAVRHFAVDDALGQALDDGGLADAGFADQHRVVLGPPLQDLDGPADLVVATDHRVELAFLGALGHVDGVLVQRLARLLDVRVVHRFAATQVGHGILQRLARHALAEQQLAEPGVLVHRGQQYQLAGDELVALLLGQAVSLVEQACEILGQVHVAGRALDLRQRVEFFVEAAAQGGDIEADLHQQGLDRTALLLEQGGKQVHRLDGRMVMANGQGLGVGERQLQLAGQTVYSHGSSFLL